jgi:hypothetical protein
VTPVESIGGLIATLSITDRWAMETHEPIANELVDLPGMPRPL